MGYSEPDSYCQEAAFGEIRRASRVGLFGWRGWEFADLYVAEGDGTAMVLEVDAGIVHAGEVGINLELAVGDEFAELEGICGRTREL
jgi:hypothetical protein